MAHTATNTQKYPGSNKLLGSTVIPLYICPSDDPSTPFVKGLSLAKTNRSVTDSLAIPVRK